MQRLISIVVGVTQARPLEISGKSPRSLAIALTWPRLALFRDDLRLGLVFSGNVVF